MDMTLLLGVDMPLFIGVDMHDGESSVMEGYICSA